MRLEELNKLEAARTAMRAKTKPHWRHTEPVKWPSINWRLVVAIALGFFMWYAGTAIMAQLLKAEAKSCCPAYPSHFE